jgi:hypothetical protein
MDTHKTPGFRDKMRIGAALANKLTPLMTPTECARKIGISTTMLRRVECLALFKIQARLTAEKLTE